MEETMKRLVQAFIGESQARNRYTIYAAVAKNEGYEHIAAAFLETADNEREHAKWLFNLINLLKEKGEDKRDVITVEAECPTIFGCTADNLKAAIEGEHYENTVMYPELAEIALKEGHPKVAARVTAIAKAEGHHEGRYKKFLSEIEGGTVFKKGKKVTWVCRKCGYVHEGNEPPENCPSCSHPKAFFEVMCE